MRSDRLRITGLKYISYEQDIEKLCRIVDRPTTVLNIFPVAAWILNIYLRKLKWIRISIYSWLVTIELNGWLIMIFFARFLSKFNNIWNPYLLPNKVNVLRTYSLRSQPETQSFPQVPRDVCALMLHLLFLATSGDSGRPVYSSGRVSAMLDFWSVRFGELLDLAEGKQDGFQAPCS